MYVFSIKNKKKNKEFIGALIDKARKKAILEKYKKEKLNRELFDDLNNQPIKDFKITILYNTSDLEKLEDMEEYYILKRKTIEKGYNTNTGYKIL